LPDHTSLLMCTRETKELVTPWWRISSEGDGYNDSISVCGNWTADWTEPRDQLYDDSQDEEDGDKQNHRKEPPFGELSVGGVHGRVDSNAKSKGKEVSKVESFAGIQSKFGKSAECAEDEEDTSDEAYELRHSKMYGYDRLHQIREERKVSMANNNNADKQSSASKVAAEHDCVNKSLSPSTNVGEIEIATVLVLSPVGEDISYGNIMEDEMLSSDLSNYIEGKRNFTR